MNNFLRVGFLPYFITAKLTKNSVVTTLFLFILLGQLLYHCLKYFLIYIYLIDLTGTQDRLEFNLEFV